MTNRIGIVFCSSCKEPYMGIMEVDFEACPHCGYKSENLEEKWKVFLEKLESERTDCTDPLHKARADYFDEILESLAKKKDKV